MENELSWIFGEGQLTLQLYICTMSDLHSHGHIMVMYNIVALTTLVTIVLHEGSVCKKEGN